MSSSFLSLAELVVLAAAWLLLPLPESWFAGVSTWRMGSLIYMLSAGGFWIWLNWPVKNGFTRFQQIKATLHRFGLQTWFWLGLLVISFAFCVILPSQTVNPSPLRRIAMLTYPVWGWGGMLAVQNLAWQLFKERTFQIRFSLKRGLGGLWTLPVVQYLILLVLVLATAALVLYPSAPVSPLRYPANDSAMFAYGGWKILNGATPYIDFWEQKPPLVFYLNALGLLLGAETFWGIWLFEVFNLGLTGFLAWVILKDVFGWKVASLTVLISLFNLFYLLEGGNLTEQYALIFQLLALTLFMKSRQAERKVWQALWIGVCGGLAFFLKQNMIGIWIAIGLIWLVDAIRAVWRRTRFDWKAGQAEVRVLLELAAGFLGLVGLVFASLVWRGIFPDFWFAAFSYNFFYSSLPLIERFTNFFQNIRDLFSISVFFLMAFPLWLGSLIFFFKTRASTPAKTLMALAGVDFLLEVLLSSITSRSYLHYRMSLWPSLLLLFAFGMEILLRKIGQGRIWLEMGLGMAICFLFLSQPISVMLEKFPVALEGTYTQTIEVILNETKPSDPILVWGGEPVLYFSSRREASTRYYFTPQILFSLGITDEIMKTFLAEVQANPPILVIDTRDPRMPRPEFLKDGSCGFQPANSGQSMRGFVDFFCAHYSPIVQLSKDQWVIYKFNKNP